MRPPAATIPILTPHIAELAGLGTAGGLLAYSVGLSASIITTIL